MDEIRWFDRLYVRMLLMFCVVAIVVGVGTWFGTSGTPEFSRGLVVGLFAMAGAGVVASGWNRWYLAERMRVVDEVVGSAFRGIELSGAFERDEVVMFGLETAERVHNLTTRIARLEQEKARLNALLGGMSEAVVMVDESERLMVANPVAERVLGLPDRYKGRLFGKVSGIQNTAQILTQVLWSGAPVLSDIDVAVEPNDTIHFSVSAGPIEVDDETVGAVMVLYDVTRLRRLERVRRDFVANVSHELRTPITSIQSASETLLMADMDVGPVSREFVEAIFRNANRMASLVEDLLILSRLEAAGGEFGTEAVDLVAIVADILDRFDSVARSSGIQLDVDLEEDLPKLVGEPRAVAHILQNLVENGIKYTPHGGRVKITAQTAQDAVSIRVADTGVGIPPEHVHRVFERFYRVDIGRSREVGGTGLGLAIVKHLVRKLGSDIVVESEPDQGSSFTLRLPIWSGRTE